MFTFYLIFYSNVNSQSLQKFMDLKFGTSSAFEDYNKTPNLCCEVQQSL